ncbi:hypothetical protein LMIY3S_01530 [Labrys miyagiensis]
MIPTARTDVRGSDIHPDMSTTGFCNPADAPHSRIFHKMIFFSKTDL